jgi:hypothetical protein
MQIGKRIQPSAFLRIGNAKRDKKNSFKNGETDNWALSLYFPAENFPGTQWLPKKMLSFVLLLNEVNMGKFTCRTVSQFKSRRVQGGGIQCNSQFCIPFRCGRQHAICFPSSGSPGSHVGPPLFGKTVRPVLGGKSDSSYDRECRSDWKRNTVIIKVHISVALHFISFHFVPIWQFTIFPHNNSVLSESGDEMIRAWNDPDKMTRDKMKEDES